MVHSHDIFLPYGMPKEFALKYKTYWTEQYLLYAYMLDNPKVQVVFGSAYVSQVIPHALDKLMQNKYPSGGASIWYWLNRD